jgi:hypothetical protein
VTHPLVHFLSKEAHVVRKIAVSIQNFLCFRPDLLRIILPMNMSDSSTGEVSIFICISSLSSVLLLIKGSGKFPKNFLEILIVTDPREELD